MQSNGWIPLWRKTADNPIWKRDLNAWHVFEGLLMLCDQKTGVWEGGRYQLALFCNLNASTTYKALKRLEKAKMITLASNTKYTTISICNMMKYAVSGNTKAEQPGNNHVTTEGHSNNNKTVRIKKDTSNKLEVLTPEQAQMEKDVEYAWQYWEDTTGLPITRSKPSNKAACRTLIKKHGMKGLETLIRVAAAASTEKYAPSVANFIQLRDKEGNLLIWARKQGQDKKGRTIKI